MKTPQWAHQKKEYDEHRMDPARAWFWQMRTGKSKQAIDNACYLWQALEIGGVIVVAPNGVHRNWTMFELPKHMWDSVPRRSHAWRNSDPENDRKFGIFMYGIDRGSLAWLTVNQESLIMEKVRHALARFIKATGSTMLVVDESHHFAVPGAKRTAVCRGLGRVCSYKRLLSGTPVENSPLQAFSQFEILEKGALGFTRYADFKKEYADYEYVTTKGGRSYPKLTRYKNLEFLKDSMSRFTSVVLRSDVEDLPETQQDVRVVEWAETTRRAWKDCKNKVSDFFRARGARNIADGGAALTKLQQIEGGYWKQDDKIEELITPESNPKLAALREEVEQHDGQSVVWCMYRHEIELVAKTFGGTVVKLYGGTPDRMADLAAFRRGDYRIAACQPQAVGEGQDLSTATKLIWFSQTPDAIIRQQANERATRVGAVGTQIVDLVIPGGVDAYYLGLTQKKVALGDDISRAGMIEILNTLETV